MKNEKLNILKAYFGYDSLRPGQDEITDAILSGRDVLGIMPTGAGKSLCFQLPALMLPGITLVISPLISLMEDQAASLTSRHINAVCINSRLDRNKLSEIYRGIPRGMYKLVYVSPERLQSAAFRNVCGQCRISLICVDEAHCIDSWGEDFRPAYRTIAGFADTVANSALHAADNADVPTAGRSRPVIAAFTATATPPAVEFIRENLDLRDPFIINTGYKREDLRFEVRKCPGNKPAVLRSLLKDRAGQCGIIYCSTRRSVEKLYRKLSDTACNAEAFTLVCKYRSGTIPAPLFKYHGGMDAASRDLNQEGFIKSSCGIMIATCAFGMGIDKSDIRFIIHYEMPGSIEDYYQEAGRASRDGNGAVCTLLYSLDDIPVRLSLIKKDAPIGHPDYKKLCSMINYCRCGSDLQEYIISYFDNSSSFRSREILRYSPRTAAKRNPRFPVCPREDLYDYLALMRKRLSDSLGINEGKTFTNSVLRAMSASLPENIPSLFLIDGVSFRNVMKYGKYFIYVISVYKDFIS